MVWLEVETKVKINDLNSIKRKIREIANLQKKELKQDEYFAIKKEKSDYPKKAFRIRKKTNKIEINFKKPLKKFSDKQIVVKQEFEFTLDNKENLENLLALFKDLGFEKWIKKTKQSETFVYKKNPKLIIEINKVKKLGNFMEIEYLCQMSELKKAKKTVQEVLNLLKIKNSEIDNTGYTKMLWKKENKN